MSSIQELLLSDIGYSSWANLRLLNCCSSLTAEELERNLHISHSNILATLCHIYDGERVWLDRLRTSPASGPWRLPTGPAPELSLNELKRNWPEIWEGYVRLLDHVSEAGLSVELITQLPSGSEPRLPFWKILRHVLDHSTLHRGQVVGMIRMLGHCPPAINPMDFFAAKKSPPKKLERGRFKMSRMKFSDSGQLGCGPLSLITRQERVGDEGFIGRRCGVA
jgi:uncharacterized damage-inducible protein DinB